MKNQGVSIVALIIVLLLLSALGFILTSLIITKQKSTPLSFRSAHAFYLAQAGIEYAIRYTCDNQSDFWTDSNNIFPMTKSLGAGSFNVAYNAGNRSITSSGTVSSGIRQIEFSKFPEYVVGGDVVPIPGDPPDDPGEEEIAIPISNNTGGTLYIFQIDIAKDLGGILGEVKFGVTSVYEDEITISSDHSNPTQLDFTETPYYALSTGTIINKFEFMNNVAVDAYTVIYHYYFEGGSEADDYTSKVKFTIS